jgi:hypothetical protein
MVTSAPFTPLPNTLYSIPKAQILFKPEGEEAFELLGDADAVEIEPTVEETDRFTNEEGVRKKVLTIVTQVDATLTLTLAQLTDRNRALSLLGELNLFNQVAAVGETFQVTTVEVGKIYQLNGFVNIDPGTITIEDSLAVPYVDQVNYKLDVETGLLEIVSKPAGADDELNVTFDALAIDDADQRAIIGLASKTANRGKLIIRGTNEVGPRVQIVLHDVQLRPAGGRSLISDSELDAIEIEGDIFRDETQPAGLELGYEYRLDQ